MKEDGGHEMEMRHNERPANCHAHPMKTNTPLVASQERILCFSYPPPPPPRSPPPEQNGKGRTSNHIIIVCSVYSGPCSSQQWAMLITAVGHAHHSSARIHASASRSHHITNTKCNPHPPPHTHTHVHVYQTTHMQTGIYPPPTHYTLTHIHITLCTR